MRLLKRNQAQDHLDESYIRRIAWRLALITGVAILVLLGALGVAVYKTTQNAFFNQVKTEVINRAQVEAAQQEAAQGVRGRTGGSTPPTTRDDPQTGIGREPVDDGVYVSVVQP